MPSRTQKQTDHDSIVTLISAVSNLDQKFTDKFGEIRNDIKEIKDNLVCRIESLEKEKADRKEIEGVQEKINELQKKVNDDIEIRTRKLEEKIVWVFAFAAGVSTVMSLGLKFFIK